jgi:hypothetical protein
MGKGVNWCTTTEPPIKTNCSSMNLADIIVQEHGHIFQLQTGIPSFQLIQDAIHFLNELGRGTVIIVHQKGENVFVSIL